MKRLLHLFLAGSSSLLLAGPGCSCGEPPPAPGTIEDLSLYFWDRFDVPADNVAQQETEIRLAVVALDDALTTLDRGGEEPEPVTADAPFTGTLRARLVENQVAALDDVSPHLDELELAQGFVLAHVSECSQQQMVELTMSNIGMQIHPDTYVAYDKRFDGEPDAFVDGDVDVVTWTTDYSIDSFPVKYDASVRGAARRISGVAGEFPRDIFLTRAFLTNAEFDDENTFHLDFQLDVYFERDNGDLMHLYVMWRRMVIAGRSSSDDFFVNTTLDGFIDWENENNAACTNGLADE